MSGEDRRDVIFLDLTPRIDAPLQVDLERPSTIAVASIDAFIMEQPADGAAAEHGQLSPRLLARTKRRDMNFTFDLERFALYTPPVGVIVSNGALLECSAPL